MWDMGMEPVRVKGASEDCGCAITRDPLRSAAVNTARKMRGFIFILVISPFCPRLRGCYEKVPSAKADSFCSSSAYPALPCWALVCRRYGADAVFAPPSRQTESFVAVFAVVLLIGPPACPNAGSTTE